MDAKLTQRERLEKAVIENMTMATQTEMKWGFDDCALWAVAPIRKALAYDPAEKFRGRYSSKIGAGRVLGRGGLAAALRNAARRYEWTRIEPANAIAGDLGLTIIAGVFSMTVCRAAGWFVARNETGFTAMEAKTQKMAWRVL